MPLRLAGPLGRVGSSRGKMTYTSKHDMSRGKTNPNSAEAHSHMIPPQVLDVTAGAQHELSIAQQQEHSSSATGPLSFAAACRCPAVHVNVPAQHSTAQHSTVQCNDKMTAAVAHLALVICSMRARGAPLSGRPPSDRKLSVDIPPALRGGKLVPLCR
jgi:hypothetical protein